MANAATRTLFGLVKQGHYSRPEGFWEQAECQDC